MDEETLTYLLALQRVEGLGNTSMRALMTAFPSPAAVFAAPAEALMSVAGIGAKTASAVREFNNWGEVKRDVLELKRRRITVVTFKDDTFPRLLKEIPDCPALLYVAGELKGDEVCVALVGSRNASAYGTYTTEKIARDLALRGVTVVSGLARGIDTAAHRGALAVGGRTIAVLGSGLDVVYPPQNLPLFKEIAETGAVVSEYPLGTRPLAPHFPARNRIISGLSHGVVVVEATEKSGSLITARLALEQGREVFSVPGGIDLPGSRGTNRLIKEGAKLVESVDDIITEILPQLEVPLAPPRRRAGEEEEKGPQEPLGEGERKVLENIDHEPRHVDVLIQRTGLTPQEVMNALLILELKGLIRQLPGKNYIREVN